MSIYQLAKHLLHDLDTPVKQQDQYQDLYEMLKQCVNRIAELEQEKLYSFQNQR